MSQGRAAELVTIGITYGNTMKLSTSYHLASTAILLLLVLSHYLMNIQVQNEYPVHSLSVQQHLSRDSQIIQDAEAGPKGWEGVVRPSRCVAG